jgi:hypothetical protein
LILVLLLLLLLLLYLFQPYHSWLRQARKPTADAGRPLRGGHCRSQMSSLPT